MAERSLLLVLQGEFQCLAAASSRTFVEPNQRAYPQGRQGCQKSPAAPAVPDGDDRDETTATTTVVVVIVVFTVLALVYVLTPSCFILPVLP